MSTVINSKIRELTELAEELGGLPMPIERILELEAMGYAVNPVTGRVTCDTDTFTLTPAGEALGIIIETGFLDD